MALVLCVLPASYARNSEEDRWSGLVDPVFQLVANHAQVFSAPLTVPYTEVPTSLAQDGDGFLWVGTQAGLERWDGYHFRTYTSADGPCALPDDNIVVLHTDTQGRLWIGTLAGGLARYDRATGCFRATPAGPHGLRSPMVLALADDGEGGLWVGTLEGLDHLDANLSHVTHVSDTSGDESPLLGNNATTLLRDRDGAVWVSTSAGLARRDRAAPNFSRVLLPAARGSAPQVRCLFQSSDGRVWIGTANGGVYVVKTATLEARPVLGIDRGEHVSSIVAAAETSSGEIWFATHGSGIIAVDSPSLRVHLIRHRADAPTSLIDDTVEDIHRDRAGLVWIASYRGVSYVPVQQGIATALGSDAANKLPASGVSALIAVGSHQVILGTQRGRIVTVAPDRSQVDDVSLKLSAQTASLDGITSLASLDDHDLFAGLRPVGLVWVSGRTHRVMRVPLPGPRSVEPVYALLIHGQELCVGGLDGLWVLARRRGRSVVSWEVVVHLQLPGVWAISAPPGNFVWLGTLDGLFRFDTSTRIVSHIRFVPAVRETSTGPFVSSLLTDRRGRLWVGTDDRGVYVLDPAAIRADTVVPEKQIDKLLPNRTVDMLLEDSSGNVWVSTDRGVARIDPENFSVRIFGRGDGLAISGYWLGSGATTPQGELLFGGSGGLTIIRPGRIDPSPYHPPIVITSVTVGHRAAPNPQYNGPGGLGSLQIPAGAHGFSIDFAALDYSAPEQISYAYKLDGYDRDWLQTGADNRTAAYTNLPPGEYLLRLRATDHAGNWISSDNDLSVRVAAAWYQTPWFHLTQALAAIGLIWLIVRARTVVMRSRHRELQMRIDRQTEALTRATEERRALIENVAHDLRTPLTSLRGYLETLRLKGLTLSVADQQNFLGIAFRQSERLTRLVGELFDLLRLEDGGVKLAMEPVQLADLLQDVLREFRLLAENKLITVHADFAPDLPMIDGDIDLLERMIDNLLDNAIRHTPDGGTIAVNLAADAEWIRLEISDTGRGIERSEMSGIFDRYFRGRAIGARGADGAGLGLAIVKRIVDLHGGHIEAESEIGVGTRFTIRVLSRA